MIGTDHLVAESDVGARAKKKCAVAGHLVLEPASAEEQLTGYEPLSEQNLCFSHAPEIKLSPSLNVRQCWHRINATPLDVALSRHPDELSEPRSCRYAGFSRISSRPLACRRGHEGFAARLICSAFTLGIFLTRVQENLAYSLHYDSY